MPARPAPDALPPPPPSPASPASTTPARRPAVSGSRPTAAPPGSRPSTARPRRRSARSPWRRPIPTSSGPAPARRWAVRDMDMMGDGIYKSTDAGETWTNMGLVETGRIGTIVIHPTNPDIVLVVRARSRDRSAEGARRLPHRERRQDLAAGAVRRREHRLLGAADVAAEPERSSSPARGRSSCRPTCCTAAAWAAASTSRTTAARRFKKISAPGPPALALRQDRRRDRAVGRQRGCMR